MARPVTLFTGQWADLTLDTLAEKVASWGYDGLELACWGDHFEVDKALESDKYIKSRKDILEKHGLKCFAIIRIWSGNVFLMRSLTSGTRASSLNGCGVTASRKACANAARKRLRRRRQRPLMGVSVVNGFTGSPVWHLIYRFPPVSDAMVDAGFKDFADRWIPILDVFAKEGIKYALEAHPAEIAYDIYTSEKTLDALKGHKSFGFNFDPITSSTSSLIRALYRTLPRQDFPRPHQGF
ncbi:MAG: TIM barrel protein [Anaerolineae bacterium]